MIPWFKIAIFAGIGLSVFLFYKWFTGVIEENKQHEITIAQQHETIKAEQMARQREIETAEQERQRRQEAEAEFEEARQKERELISLFQEHDFDNLLQKKPGLILPRVNASTKRVFKDAANSINFNPAGTDQMPEPAGS